MRKISVLIALLIVLAFSGIPFAQDCTVTVTVGGVTTPPCVDNRLDIPVYMNNPCWVGGFSIQISMTDPSWFEFDPDDPYAADTIGSRHTNWGVFGFTVHQYGYLITVTALGDDGGGNGQNLPPGDGLIFTLHGDFDNKDVSDTCQLINFGTTTVADTTGWILFPKILVRDSVCVDPCDSNQVRGDANNSGSLNGLDVTYLINYFKGGSSICLGCPCGGDANNSGNANGLDVIFLVNYFKGGPAPVPCE
jgi:hypothetical protein